MSHSTAQAWAATRTLAGISGGIAGALHGAHALRQDWIEQCERANRDSFTETEPEADNPSFAPPPRDSSQPAAERTAARERLAGLTTLLGTLPGK